MDKFSKWGFVSLYCEICLAGFCEAFSFVWLGNIFCIAAVATIVVGVCQNICETPKSAQNEKD